jgi:hypothetical protein
LSLAIVVDTSDPDAVAQAQRSGEVIANMVVGASGEAALYTAGPEPQEVLPFTKDPNQLVNALKHLEVKARGPDITAPLQMAISRLHHQPLQNTRAVIVITRHSSNGGNFARAIIEASMSDAVTVFRISPNTPKRKPEPNPIGPDHNGPGPGSSRQQPTVPTVGAQPIPQPAPGTVGNLDPSAIAAVIGKLGGLFGSKGTDYVYQTGGLTLKPSNDGAFDRELSSIGDALRGVYHVFYRPNDLTPQPQLHSIQVRVLRSRLGTVAYRRTYVGVRAQ